MTRPYFVVSTGRCGSGLLSEILAAHPEVLSLSECLVNLRPDAFPPGQLSAQEFWEHLSRPRGKLSLLLHHRLESPEIRYPVDAGLRFNRQTGLPPLSPTCLPLLFSDPDAALDELELDVAGFPTATAGDHFQRLFDGMAERLGRRIWVERSGGSLAGVGALIANFPSARYVHLHRDGPATASSMSRHSMFRLQLIASMLERELGHDPYETPDPSDRDHISGPWRATLPSEFDVDAFWSLDIPMERFGRMWSAMILRGMRALAAVPAADVLHLSYESLLADPAAPIGRLLDFLGVPSPDASWLAEAASRVKASSSGRQPPSVGLVRACESGMRTLRSIAGSTRSDAGNGPAAVARRRPARADLPPGPTEDLASVLARFFADPEGLFTECRDRFGDCFSLPLPGTRRRPRPAVVVSAPAAVKELLMSGPVLSIVKPSRYIMARTLGEESTFLLDDDAHVARRRTISPWFHGDALARWERLTVEIAEREVACWPLDEPTELGPRLYAIVLEIILEILLGEVEPHRLAALRQLAPEIWSQDRVGGLGWQGSDVSEPRAAVDELLSAELRARRLASVDSRTDVLSGLLDPAAEHQEVLSDAQLRDELVTLIVAGHENTAAGLAWTFELLMRNPETLARARRDAAGGDGRYLAAVVKEGLRCKPPTFFVNRTLRRPWTVAGYTLPAGTDIAACIYLVHQRPDLYLEPDRFRPERFLDNGPLRFNWLTFGAGIRRCLGGAFAEIEMRAVLRAVLARAEPEPAGAGPLPRGTWHSVVFRPSGVTPAVLRDRALDQHTLVACAHGGWGRCDSKGVSSPGAEAGP